MMYSRFTVLVMLMTLSTLLANAAPTPAIPSDMTHNEVYDAVDLHKAQHAAAVLSEQSAAKKCVLRILPHLRVKINKINYQR